ncbi:MAG: prepilin-type N-terminal cleavage/methylation domain-containing protein [Candidatus Obscuribacter sp.]|jgi:hypothetical protein|nr:prepilin-type N-terminal cleavage/methylation domain-containing protein [Candidatus Obscuribacter sp.]MDQ5967910.1 Prepilin-type N-terminal cleavage/methylation protein [Cyanobacteriota bacterium erpe_2018_sw_39hr_WHONDRS-SW48-000098_B_bin.30]MBK9201796.1 prepilin-type N-terminal cleavage/methylation domain-containing protein [Candidatus Obscuribacter sp.]MBK9620085.1 prepilin-type N-terminal cleavage/methylation domain-containing protein [Candidatus Obscuribacter sp.]MBK9770450.1 prepilin-t
MRAGYYQPKRSRSGFSLIEVMISGFLLVLLAVFAADLCLLIFGCSVNDKCCRDVVRAAAQQPNAIKALQFAQASVKNHKTDGTFISPITLVGNTVNYNDFGGAPPVGQAPFVQVTTRVTVTLPAPIYFFGGTFTNQMDFTQTYTSPIVKTKYLLP